MGNGYVKKSTTRVLYIIILMKSFFFLSALLRTKLPRRRRRRRRNSKIIIIAVYIIIYFIMIWRIIRLLVGWLPRRIYIYIYICSRSGVGRVWNVGGPSRNDDCSPVECHLLGVSSHKSRGHHHYTI